MRPDRLARARELAERPARALRQASAVDGLIVQLIDGSVWGPLSGHPCRLIIAPRLRERGGLYVHCDHDGLRDAWALADAAGVDQDSLAALPAESDTHLRPME